MLKRLTIQQLTNMKGKPVFYKIDEELQPLTPVGKWVLIPEDTDDNASELWEQLLNDFTLGEFFEREPEDLMEAVKHHEMCMKNLTALVKDLKNYNDTYGWKELPTLPDVSGDYWTHCVGTSLTLTDEEFSLFFEKDTNTWHLSRFSDEPITHLDVVAWKMIEPYKLKR